MSDALNFLQKWTPGGPWVLTAISPEGRGIETRTFRDPAECDAWIGKHDGTRNLYFHVNPLLRDVDKKAGREDIAAMSWLHVDIDPRAGENLDEERARALKLLQSPPDGVPAPTVIVFSGGGYQGFWKLRTPFPVGGDLAAAEEAARYNIQLEVLFGADNCHNIDRIMRLPGTMNIPDARKKAKGRSAVKAQLVVFSDVTYELSEFVPAPIKQAAPAESGLGWTPSNVQPISGNIARLSSVDDLPDTVRALTKVIIVQGVDPDNPTKHSSRSEWLFRVVCDLIRAEVPDETIFSVITDPDFRISASVLDKGSRAERYALNQIAKGHEAAIDPVLMEMNSKFAVVGNLGGKCRIIEEVPDAVFQGRTRLSKQTFEDFRNRFLHRKVQAGVSPKGEPIYKPLGTWWTTHEKRKQFDTVIFSPGRDVPGAYNLWQGFACESRAGDCSLFLGHIYENICSSNDDHYNYIMGWMATAVQFPARPGETAIVLRGRRGTGKSFFVKEFGRLWGRHFLQVSDAKHLVGNFNSHLRDCVVLFGDEAFYAGDKKHESVLKMLVTEENIMYEMKGVDSEAGPNFTHIFLASNSTWVIPAGDAERRFFVLDVADSRMQDSAYFARIREQMDNGGREAFLHMLMTYPLEGYAVRTVPQTTALADQKLYSLGPEEEWWYTKLTEGRILPWQETWPDWVTREDLFGDYVSHMQKVGRNYRASPTVLGRFLRRVTPTLTVRQQKVVVTDVWEGGGQTTAVRPAYVLPSLDACRKYWTDTFGSFGDW